MDRFDFCAVKVLGRYLEKRGITLKVGDRFVPEGAGGAFDSFERQMLLRENPTRYEVTHELSHYIQYRNLGPSAYQALSRRAKEQFVFDMLERSPARWGKLIYAEQQEAIDYILSLGGVVLR